MSIENLVNRVLISTGANPKNRGFQFLARAIVLEYENPDNPGITKWLYPVLAREFGQTTACIERSIRTVVHNTGSKHRTNGAFIRATVWFINDYLTNGPTACGVDRMKEVLFERCFHYYKKYSREVDSNSYNKFNALFEVVTELELVDEYNDFKKYSPLARL